MASRSFISFGVSAGPEGDHVTAEARLNGVVMHAERRANALTGQTFIVARAACVAFDVDVCMPDEPAVPAIGAVVGGQVFMTGSLSEGWTSIPAKDTLRVRLSRLVGRKAGIDP